MQQVPEEIDRVMVGIEAYLSIRRHTSSNGYSVFEDSETGEAVMSFFILLLIFCLLSDPLFSIWELLFTNLHNPDFNYQ